MGSDPRCLVALPRAPLSGLNPGDGAVAVICDPNRFATHGDGARFGSDLDRVAVGLAALEVDLGDGVVVGVGDPDGAGAGVDPARVAADFDRVAEQPPGRGVDFGDGAGAAVGDPHQAI